MTTDQENQQETSPGLTVGDAIVVVALLMFAVGWIVLWVLGIAASYDEKEKIDENLAFYLFVITFIPPVLAGIGVWKIIKKKLNIDD